jgi:Ca-activated chloride channel family protein
MRQRAPDDADKTIIELALGHQLVTRLTSLVAVDKTPSRPEGAPLKVSELPLNLPAGWDFAKVFGERPRPVSLPNERRADAGNGPVELAMAKRAVPVAMQNPGAVVLPKGATDAELKMIVGALLMMLTLIFFAFNRRRSCPS